MSQDPSLQITQNLSAYVAGALAADPLQEHRLLGRLHVLDTLASMVACRDLEAAVLARRYAQKLSGGAATATMLSTFDRASLVEAAFAGAMTGHAAEINDFNPSAFVQPGPPVLSVALALAETRGATGSELLRAVMIGYEVAGRLPKALGIGNLRRAGVANHAVGPLFGAAATAAALLRLEPGQIDHVWTYCAQQAGGSWQWLLDVEHLEKAFVFAGKGARDGLHAALMAEAGFRGVRNALDHPEGWLRSGAFAGGDCDPACLTADLWRRSELPLTAFKRYPVGGPTQPAVEGLLSVLPDLQGATVEGVRIEMPGRWQAFRDAAMPALNLRYLTAIILIDGGLDFVAAQSLSRMADDPQVRDMMDRVEIVHDPAQEAAPGTPRTESARVIVRLRGGREVQAYTPYVLGFPSHPMAPGDVEAKALQLMSPHLGEARAQQVIDAVAKIESLDRASALTGLIAR